MTYTLDTNITQHLNSIIHFNPFDAVIVITEKEQQFCVELVNAKATILFDKRFENRTPAHQFFIPTDWEKIKRCIENANNGAHYIFLENEKQIVVQVIPKVLEEEVFYFIIMRHDSNNAEENNRFNLYPSYEDELTGLLTRRALNQRWSY